MSRNPIKQLAGETAIYGLSTILARILNFLLVPLYTRLLATDAYGASTEIFAFIAVFQVVLVLGLETGCFKFANNHQNPHLVFGNALSTVGVTSALFVCLTLFLAKPVSVLLGDAGYYRCIRYTGVILASDTITSIFFAKLRFEHKAIRFAVFKTIKILCETGTNLLLFLWAPAYFVHHPDSVLLHFIAPTPDYSYIIFSICISCIVCFVLFVPDLFKVRCTFEKTLWKQMMLFSLPLMVAGLPGIINDMIDRPLFRVLAPGGLSDLGIFQAGAKLAVLVTLFIQMFRFAAEPFFFSKAKERDSKILYAKVMNYFVGFVMLVFLGVLLYIDVIQYFIGRDFRKGIEILPVMMGAYILLGIQFNVSMWFKLSGMTKYAVYITLAGLAVTLLANVLFMPQYSYKAAAWGHFCSYLIMLLINIYLGNKYYPIPYQWGRIGSYVGAGLAIWAVSLLLPQMPLAVKLGVHTVLIGGYVVFAWWREVK